MKIKEVYESCSKCEGRGTLFVYRPYMYEGCGFVNCPECDVFGMVTNHYTDESFILDERENVDYSKGVE